MKKILLLNVLLFMGGILESNAQTTVDFDNYQLLKSSGPLPKDVTTTTTTKLKKSLEKIDKKDISRKEKNAQRSFQLYVNFMVDENLLSGYVLYNDPVGDYVNKVAQKLLKDNMSLYNEMRFYVIEYPVVNALTTPTGIVFITVGLLAHLENEAQLALILSHEIQHYSKNHSYKEYTFEPQIDKKGNKESNTKEFESFLQKSAYSREMETEADKEGLELYGESGYSLEVIESVFDILQFSHLPFDEVSFKPSVLETKNLKFPKSFTPADSILTPIDINSDDYDDEYLSHPNVKKRREVLLAIAAKMKSSGSALYLVGEKEFEDARKIARYEYVHICMIYHHYEEAFVSLNILLSENANSHYLQRNLNHCLYAMAKLQLHYGNTNFTKVWHTSYKKIEGNGGGAYYFVGTMIKSDIGLVTAALENIWTYHLNNPDDKNSIKMIEELTTIFGTKYKLTAEDLKKLDPSKTLNGKAPKKGKTIKKKTKNKVDEDASNDEEEEEIEESKSKGKSKGKNKEKTTKEKKEKKKKKKKKSKADYQEYFNEDSIRNVSRPIFYSVLKNLANDESFAKIMTKSLKEYKAVQKKKNEEDEENSPIVAAEYIDEEYNAFDIYEFDESVSVEKMVLLSPKYTKLNHNKKEKNRFVSSENKVIELSEAIKYVAEKAEIQIDDINTKTLKEGDAEKLNEMSLINNFLVEKSDDPEISLIPIDQTAIDQFITNHNTSLIFKLSVTGVKEKVNGAEIAWALATVGCILVASLIGGTVQLDYNPLKPLYKNNHYTIFFANVIDLKTGKDVYGRAVMFNHGDRKILVKMHLYDILYQMKNKK